MLLFDHFRKQSFADVLQNSCFWKFRKFRRKKPVLESLFNKAAGLKETPTQVFSCEICEIFKNTFFYGTTPVAASALYKV